jgi:hypothetical protein
LHYAALDALATLKVYQALVAKPGLFKPGPAGKLAAVRPDDAVVLVTPGKPEAVAEARVVHPPVETSVLWCITQQVR